MPRILTLVPVLWLVLSAGDIAAQKIRMVRTQDGSRFLLMPTGGPPVVHWVTLIPAGIHEDPAGLEGVSLALVRASLAGTYALGSEDPLKEAAAVARALSLARQVSTNGGKDPAVKALLAQAEAEVRRLARPLAWEKALRAAPSSGSQLRVVPGAVLLKVTTTTRGLQRVAELLKDRRDHALLRGVHDHFRQVQAERKAQFAQDQRTPLRRRLVAKACADHPLGRFYTLGNVKNLSFEAATDAYRRLNDPKRSRQVLAGGFDADVVEVALKQVFKEAPAQPPKVKLPRLHAGHRPAEHPATETHDSLALGCPIPKGASAQDLVVFVGWLAGDSDSYLADALRARGHPRVRVEATAPFPAPGGLLLVEITKPDAKLTADSKLCKDLREILNKAMGQAPAEAQVARARRHFLATRASMLSNASSMALYMGQVWALTGKVPTAELNVEARVSGATIQKMCRQMFKEDTRILMLPGGDS
jgi:predicted Zn-dependent peptidase